MLKEKSERKKNGDSFFVLVPSFSVVLNCTSEPLSSAEAHAKPCSLFSHSLKEETDKSSDVGVC